MVKLVVQRVLSATVKVDDQLVSCIGKGLLVYVGVSTSDTVVEVEKACDKLLALKVYDNGTKRWASNVVQQSFEVLCVSQFTLHATLKSNKPDFHKSMGGSDARILYDHFVERLRNTYDKEKVKDGAFGQYMHIESTNEGPVNILLDTNNK